MKINFKRIFVGVALVGSFLLGAQLCSTHTQGETKTEVIHDTIYHPGDTVKLPSKKEYVPEYVYMVQEIDSFKIAQIYKIRGYNETYEDSSIVINVQDSVLGYLMGQKLSYRLKGIKQINTTTTSTVTVEKKIPFKYEFSAGFQASTIGFSPQLQLTVKNIEYGVGYDYFNKAPNVSLKYIIFRR